MHVVGSNHRQVNLPYREPKCTVVLCSAHHTAHKCCCQVYGPAGKWQKIGMATYLVKPKALVVQCSAETGYCNSDWQRSVRAAQGTQPGLQSWGCFGAFWSAVFKSGRQVSPLTIFCSLWNLCKHSFLQQSASHFSCVLYGKVSPLLLN